jgi:poly(hydroxyalkanoate) granule-associated protein
MTTRKTAKKNVDIPALKDSAHHIWLAGLGAFSLAGEEGSKLFQQLVEKGGELEQANKARISQLAEKVQGLKGEARTAMQKVANPIENTINSAIQKLGVPSREEIVTLTKRVEELTKAVAKTKTASRRSEA